MTYKNENLQIGRNQSNKPRKEKAIDIIGEDNYREILLFHVDLAKNSPNEETRIKCGQYILDKIMPKPRVEGSFVNINLTEMHNMDDVLTNEIIILNKVCNGEISLEEGKELFALTTETRKTFEQTEIANMINDFYEKLKKNSPN